MEQFANKILDITPQYLLALSKNVDVLSRYYQQERMGSLTQQFSNMLGLQFGELSQFLSLYHEDKIMRQNSVLRCKVNMEIYCWEKLTALLRIDKREIAEICDKLIEQLKEHVSYFQALIFGQRNAKIAFVDKEKDKIIFGLRREVGIKREYTQDLEQRIHELQDQNSKLYSKIITNAKNTVDFSINSPSKIKQLMNGQSISAIDRPSSPRKKLSSRSYQQQIYEIMQAKQKQESIQDRRCSLDDYLKTYFTVKYGKPLAEQNQFAFRQMVNFLARNQQKCIFVLFAAIIEGQCDEAYFNEHRQSYDRIVKCVKRFICQKYNKSLYDLDRLFDSKNIDERNDFLLSQTDLDPILTNVYRSNQVQTLQLILSELLSARPNSTTPAGKIYCKKLINQILNYQLKRHLMKIQDILREVNKIIDATTRFLTFQQLQKILVKVVKDKNRYQLLLRHQQQWIQKRFTVSEAIETIQRIRRVKLTKKQ